MARARRSSDQTPAGPSEKIAGSDPDERGRHQTPTIPVLLLTERKLAFPGTLGPYAQPADPAVRRADAYERDSDPTRYLMELLDAVQTTKATQPATTPVAGLHPAARRHLVDAADTLEHARSAAGTAFWPVPDPPLYF